MIGSAEDFDAFYRAERDKVGQGHQGNRNGQGLGARLARAGNRHYPLTSWTGIRSANDWTAEETIMAWTTPTLVEICVGLEINGYLPAEF